MDVLFDILNAISSITDGIIDGIIYLFVPSPGWFDAQFQAIQNILNARLGGLLGVMDALQTGFANMSSNSNASSAFVLRFPQNSVMGGASFDLFSGGGNSLFRYIRMIISGILIVSVTMFGYNRLRSMLTA